MSEHNQKKIFQQNIIKYVEKSGKSQREIAEAIDVSPQTFNTWMQGIAIPRMDKIQKLADYFKINKSQLVDNAPDYYIDEETKEIAQAIASNKELGLLFDAARTAAPEDLKTTHDMLLALKRKEQNDEEPC